MAEILHFEILRKHGQTHTHTHTQTDRHGHYNTSPSPYGGRGNQYVADRQETQHIDDVMSCGYSGCIHCLHDPQTHENDITYAFMSADVYTARRPSRYIIKEDSASLPWPSQYLL